MPDDTRGTAAGHENQRRGIGQRLVERLLARYSHVRRIVSDTAGEGFQVALGMLATITLLSLLVASLIPKVDSKKVIADETKERVADVSSKRL